MKRPVILSPVQAGHPGHHGVPARLTAEDSLETNQDLDHVSPDHVKDKNLSSKSASQRLAQPG